MNKKDLLAIMVFAIDRDMMGYTFMEVWVKLCSYVDDMTEYFDITPDEVIRGIINDAKVNIVSGYCSYGKLDKQIYEMGDEVGY